MKFSLPYGPMLTKMKKLIKIQKFKILKNGKRGLEIWWIATFPQNLVLIPLMVSEKTHFMDDDGRRMPAPRQ